MATAGLVEEEDEEEAVVAVCLPCGPFAAWGQPSWVQKGLRETLEHGEVTERCWGYGKEEGECKQEFLGSWKSWAAGLPVC